MSQVREAILTQLLNAGSPVSGDQIAGDLGISRTAVWKHIRSLQKQGIHITAIRGRGYELHDDVLTASGIHDHLASRPPQLIGRRIEHLDSTDSTNLEILRRAEQGAKEGLVIFAERQTNGRGRMGRRWHTLPASALAFSVLLRPAVPPQRVCELPLVAGYAIHRALSPLAPNIGLKWPNDLVHQGAKLGGILTEMRAEPGLVHAVAIGIGLNIHPPRTGWPQDIGQPVTDLASVSRGRLRRQQVAAACIAALDACYRNWLEQGFEPIRKAWWQAHVAPDGWVRVRDAEGSIEGIARGLDDDGALLLETASGIQRIIAGDLEVLQ